MDETKLAVEKVIKGGQRAWEEGIQRLGSQKRLLSSQFRAVVRQNGWEDGGWMRRNLQRRSGNEKKSGRRVQPVSNKSLLEGTTSTTAAFAPGSKKEARRAEMAIGGVIEQPRLDQLLKHPLAIISYVPRELALFAAGAVAGAAAKTVTAPLDRIKLLMQVHGIQMVEEGSKRGIGFLEAILKIVNEEGFKGFWKGNVPQVIRVIPYSAVQLFAYEAYKKLLKGDKEEISVVARLTAGACAGMTSTLVTYPLDVLRLRLAVDPATKSMCQVAATMFREEGVAAFWRGLGPSLLGIAPYIALNFCVFDLIKKSLPEDFKKRPEASFATALVSASFATAMCYPLDTVRRQMQMRGTPFNSVLDAIPGIIARDGLLGLYRGFVPNILKSLPNSSIRLTTFDAAKNIIHASEIEFERLVQEEQKQQQQQLSSSQ